MTAHTGSSPSDDPGECAAVLAANAAFYDAFESRSLSAMDAVWGHGDDVFCTHPGWPTLRGWQDVRRSWEMLLQNPQRLQFIITNESVRIEGTMAWVLCDENVLDAAGAAHGSTVSACNLYVRTPLVARVTRADTPSDRGTDPRSAGPLGHTWKLVGHHGSLVHASLA